MTDGPSPMTARTTSSAHKPAPADNVSATCRSEESSGATTLAIPPCAQLVLLSVGAFLLMTTTRPWRLR